MMFRAIEEINIMGNQDQLCLSYSDAYLVIILFLGIEKKFFKKCLVYWLFTVHVSVCDFV